MPYTWETRSAEDEELRAWPHQSLPPKGFAAFMGATVVLIMVPLFLPVVAPYGVDLVWFGIITIVGAEIGLLTPPLGISCEVIKSTLQDDRISLYDVFAGAFPFAVMMLVVLILLIAFPQLSLVLV